MSVKGRVVVIDDEVNAAAALETLLREDGYEVARATTRAPGLRCWRRQDADVVLTDLRMPGMDGLELLATHQGDPARDHGHPHDRLRHGEDGGQGHEARGRGLPGQAHRRRGAGGRARAGPGEEAACSTRPGSCASASSTSTASTTWWARARRCSRSFKTIRQVAPSSRLGAAPRRERHRQGAVRPGPPPEQPPARQALRQGGLRRPARDPARERALRPREGLLHRRRLHPRRPLRGRRRRHPLPRRDRRHLAHRPGEAAALPGGARVRAGGRQQDLQGGRADRGRHPPRPQEEARGGHLPRGPLLPAERDRDPDPAAARAAAATSRCSPTTSCGSTRTRTGRRSRASPTTRWPSCSATPGRATCASWRTRSSGRWSSPSEPHPHARPLPDPAQAAAAESGAGRGRRQPGSCASRAAPSPTSSARPSCARWRRWAAAPRGPPAILDISAAQDPVQAEGVPAAGAVAAAERAGSGLAD